MFTPEFNYEIKCIKAKTNHVSDFLSRKHREVHKVSYDVIRKLVSIATVHINERTKQELNQEYNKEKFLKKYITTPKKHFYCKNGRLYIDRRLCTPHGTMRKQLLFPNHPSLLGAHSGAQRTIFLVKRGVFWPNISDEIEKYIKNCLACQRLKCSNRKLYGKPSPFPTPSKKWEVISMYSILKVPQTKNKLSSCLVGLENL